MTLSLIASLATCAALATAARCEERACTAARLASSAPLRAVMSGGPCRRAVRLREAQRACGVVPSLPGARDLVLLGNWRRVVGVRR